jgi:16S rRNA (guanine527-N7)-methyltransferase
VTSDRRSGPRTNERRGRFSGGCRAPHEARPDRRDGPPPTRVFPALPTDPSRLPPLPAAFDDALDAGLAALRLQLPDGARAAIDGHVRLLLAWNASINLTAIIDPAEVALRHVVDSLTAAPVLAEGAPSTGLRFLDLGSGGGFPGLPMAVALPTSRATVVDSVAKKARFLETVVRATGLDERVDVVAGRAESLAPRGGWDVVTARAVGSLDALVELALPLLRVGGRLVAWKRGDIGGELEAGARAAEVLGGGPPEIRPTKVPGLEGHALVLVEKVAPTPQGYPRDPAQRRRTPW